MEGGIRNGEQDVRQMFIHSDLFFFFWVAVRAERIYRAACRVEGTLGSSSVPFFPGLLLYTPIAVDPFQVSG